MLMMPASKPLERIAEHNESDVAGRVDQALNYIESQYRKALDDMYRYPYYDWAVVIRAEFIKNSHMYLNAMTYDDLYMMGDPVTSYTDSLYSVMNALPPASVLPREELEIFNECLNARVDSLDASWNQNI